MVDFDVEEIMEDYYNTGYEPGKAFIYGFNEDGRVRRECVETYGVDTPGEPVVYDTRTKNFHIFPNSMEITDEILQSEADLRLKVYNYFIEYCNNNKETFDVIKYEKVDLLKMQGLKNYEYLKKCMIKW